MSKNSRELRKDIFLSVEKLPSTDTTVRFRYNLECFGCPRECAMNFIIPVKLSFASGVKFAATFSSLCAKLEKEVVPSVEPVGPKQAELFVGGDN